jgi:ubiquinone/menaquinone biosynthesis C-methylase UbiE
MLADLSHICPRWLAPVLDNPIRRLIHNPEKILSGFIGNGQTVLDLGCGSGTFTIALAKMVGETGKVIAVDVQDEMLQMVKKKAVKEGLESRIMTFKKCIK